MIDHNYIVVSSYWLSQFIKLNNSAFSSMGTHDPSAEGDAANDTTLSFSKGPLELLGELPVECRDSVSSWNTGLLDLLISPKWKGDRERGMVVGLWGSATFSGSWDQMRRAPSWLPVANIKGSSAAWFHAIHVRSPLCAWARTWCSRAPDSWSQIWMSPAASNLL